MQEHTRTQGGGVDDRYLAVPQVSIDSLRLIFKLAEQASQLQLSIKEQVERKATSMLGFGGLVAAWETQMLSELARQASPASKGIVWAFVVAVILTMASCLCSFFALRSWNYSFPDVAALSSFEDMRREETIVLGKATNALLEATRANTVANQRKVRLLQAAYALFVVDVVLLISSFALVWSRRLVEV